MKNKQKYHFRRAKHDSPRSCDFPCVCLSDKKSHSLQIKEDISPSNTLNNCNKGLGKFKTSPGFDKDHHKSHSKQSFESFSSKEDSSTCWKTFKCL